MFLAFALLVIAIATLWPMPGPSHQWAFCLACGAHGTSDLLLNIALFMPLGAALALRGRRSSSIAVLAGLLSAAIELSQFYIPGRDPSLSDIVSNTLGAVFGALLVHSARFWLFRVGFVVTLALAGVLVIILVKTYFQSVFEFPHKMFPELESLLIGSRYA